MTRLLHIALLSLGFFLSACCPKPRGVEVASPPRQGAVLPEAPIILPLRPYTLRPYNLTAVVVDVGVGNRTLPFFFDTGQGVTNVTPNLARVLNCKQQDRLTGFRMLGQRLDFPYCTDVVLQYGSHPVRHGAVGVLDVMSFLPPGLPPVGGVVSLTSFPDTPITIDYPNKRIVLESADSWPRRVQSMKRLQTRLGLDCGGACLSVFAAIRGPHGLGWFELDSGNLGPIIVSRHAAARLGIDMQSASVQPVAKPGAEPTSWRVPRVKLNVVGLGVVEQDVLVREGLIYDGNLGVSFFSETVVSIDIRSGQAWTARK